MTTITSSTPNSGSTTNPVSVASDTSAGAAGGSVINVSSLVSELVAATEAPQQSLIANQTAAVTANISALGTLKSALSTFQTSLASLSTPSAFNAATATSSDHTVFTATAGTGAVQGTYAITVSNLASAQQLLSSAFVGGSSATVGTGTLTLSLGGTSFDVNIDSTDNTVAGVAAAINSASNNPGITATVFTGTDGAHLVLSSTLTGAANAIQVTESDAGTGLAALTYGNGNTANYTEQSPAQDAAFTLAGVPYTSASNTVTGAISGVTLNLVGKTASGTNATLSVATDTSTVFANVQAFVSAYNALQGNLASLGGFDASSGTAGQMMGNPVLTGIQSQIQQTLYSFVGSSNFNSLASVGIMAQSDGTLSINGTTLSNALSTNFSAVSQLFSATDGIAARLSDEVTSDLAGGGTIDTYGKSLTSQENALTQQSNTLSTQMDALTTSLTRQYSALNALLSQLQSTSSYLTQAFASLPSVQGQPRA